MKFTPAGGAVKVAAGPYEKDPNLLLVEVSDTGCGIDAESALHTFEHLYQVTDPGRAGRRGLGLGLYIAKDLVTRQGGEIWVESELQVGSRFFFTLPIFSLAGLIRPILRHEKKPGEAIAVLTVEIDSRDGSPDVPIRIRDLARSVLQQCLRPDTDVLLPNIGPDCDHKLFFVVAYTQPQGAEIIGRRILGQLREHAEFQSNEFIFAVSHSFLRPTARGADESMEMFEEQVAAEVRDHINNGCLQGEI
jgi:Histidine kinase-, DNA gyrase B-, and HSP90-like ATPase